jgi:hypothetical protein
MDPESTSAADVHRPPAHDAARLLAGCAFILLAACLAFWFAGALARLATNGELVLRQAGLEETRIWLVRQPDSTGLGLSDSRRIAGEQAENRVCLRTRIRFLLWRGDDSRTNLEECRCYDRQGGAWIAGPACTESNGLP